jgi:hypothetical protein
MAKRKTTAAAAEKTSPRQASSDIETLRKQLAAYQQVFDEVEMFTDLVRRQDDEVATANEAMLAAKAAYEDAKLQLHTAREARDGTKHSLFVFLRPGPMEILPLFDRMAPADEAKHGAHSEEWRKEPLSALRLSLVATGFLTAADVIFVGQLQDRVQDEPEDWWCAIDGLNSATAAAIADRLNDFIFERSKK